jgi:hypothetical protein
MMWLHDIDKVIRPVLGGLIGSVTHAELAMFHNCWEKWFESET